MDIKNWHAPKVPRPLRDPDLHQIGYTISRGVHMLSLSFGRSSLQSRIVCSHFVVNIGVNSYWAQGLKPPPPTFMIMGLAYMTSSPHFCDVILSKLCFNCLHWFYAMLAVRPFIPCCARHFKKGAKFAGFVGHRMTKMLSAFRGASPPYPLTRGSAPGPRCTRHGAPNSFCRLWSSCLEPPPLILTSLRLWLSTVAAMARPIYSGVTIIFGPPANKRYGPER